MALQSIVTLDEKKPPGQFNVKPEALIYNNLTEGNALKG
jgi:hypothetical protein